MIHKASDIFRYSLFSDIFQSLVTSIIVKWAALISRVRSVKLVCILLLKSSRAASVYDASGARRDLQNSAQKCRGMHCYKPVALVINPLENEAPQLAVLSISRSLFRLIKRRHAPRPSSLGPVGSLVPSVTSWDAWNARMKSRWILGWIRYIARIRHSLRLHLYPTRNYFESLLKHYDLTSICIYEYMYIYIYISTSWYDNNKGKRHNYLNMLG